MTISSTTVKNSYSGDGSTVTFNYTFKIFDETDLEVIIRTDSTGTETTKTLNTHYSITGVGNASGGSITFLVDATATPPYDYTPASGETVVLRRNVPQTQAIDYIANDPFPAESHEEGLDRSMMAIQQLQEEVDRSLKLSKTNTMTSTEFTVGATARAGKFLSFDSNGELVVSQEVGTFQGDWSSGTAYSARDIVKDTYNNNIYIANTGHTSSGSQPLSTNTDSAKWDLLVDAESATNAQTAAEAAQTAAETAQAAAELAETNAETAETNSAASAAAALTSENNTATSESNAASSAAAAQTAQTAAETALDTFTDQYLGTKTSDPTVDNDGDALTDGDLYFNTTDNVMKVYDLGNTEWKQLTPTTSQQSNIDSVVANATNINAVAGNETNINAVNSNSTNINTVAGINSDVTTVSGISANVTSVAGNETNINSVAGNSTNINSVATNISDVTSVAGSISSVNTAASNLDDINAFANIYLGPNATAPTLDPDGSALDVGDLYFDTASDQLKVYSSSGWQNAGSSVNGTAARFKYTATSGQTTFSGADDNAETLLYDAGYIDVYLNGIHLDPSDYTATSGTSVVLNSGANLNDELYIIAFGTFVLTDISASNITSGTLNNARLTGSGQITINGTAVALGDSITTFTRPTVTSITPSTITNAQTSINITGTGFVSVPIVEAIGTDGSIIRADTVTYNSSTSLTVNFTIATDSTYYIRVENNDGFAGRSSSALLTVSDAPTWTTAAGSLGTFSQGDAISETVVATSDSTIAYSIASGSLPTGLSLNSSTGVISGTESGTDTSNTTYNFTLRATDDESQTADRAFSMTIEVGITEGMQFN